MHTQTHARIVAQLELMAGQLEDGNFDAAARTGTALLAAAPSHPGVHRNLALLAHATGDIPKAVEHMRRACGFAPDDATLHKQLASLLVNHQRLSEALVHFDASLKLVPDDGHTWYLAGLALLRQGSAPLAVRALQYARRYLPDDLRLQQAFAHASFDGGLPENALPVWRSFANTRPDDLVTQLKLGELLSRNGKYEEALTHFAQLAQQPSFAADASMAMAQAHEDLGNRPQAADAYRQALKARPGWAMPSAGLLQLQPENASESEVDHVRQLLADTTTPDAERALLGYAVGKVYDRHGEYANAFDCWRQANRARRRMVGEPNPQALGRRVDALMQHCARWPFASHIPIQPAAIGRRMVLIVGMPRSGTTLTEQIIASHPLAHGCGELAELPLLASALWPSLQPHPPAWSAPLTSEVLGEAAASYSRAASRGASLEAQVLVDKAPLNFFNLWLIALLRPDTKIVWCRRHPLDIAVSIYGENFALEERLCTRLDGIGHYILAQEKLMRHWQQVLPLPILEVAYESLVSDPENNARRIVEFAGLEWDPACLQFHKRETGVQTPSRWQVRQPMHTRSVGRWRNYRQYLQPLLDLLPQSDA
jgi:tetratricopeptide (TPR) repeat protein